MNWDIQAFLYHKYAELTNRQFRWIVVSPKKPHTQRIFWLPDMRFIERGESRFLEAQELFKQFNKNEEINIVDSLDAPKWAD